MLRETLLVGSADAAARISRRYRVDPEQAAADLRGFLAELVEKRLIRPRAQASQPHRGPPPIRGWAAGWALRLAYAGSAALRWPLRGQSRVLLALAHVSLRLLGWPGTLNVWRRFGGRGKRHPAAEEEAGLVEAVDAAVRAAASAHPLNVECKERGPVCWSLLRSRGLPAELVLGIDLLPFASHAWCRLGSRVVGDFPDRCDRFTPVLTYL